MDVYRLRLFASTEETRTPVWEQELRASNLENARLQARERMTIPASKLKARFVDLSDEAYKTVWSADLAEAGHDE